MTYSVLVGAGQWHGAPEDVPVEGLFGLDAAEGVWRSLENGLPSKAEVRCITVRRDRPEVIYVGTQSGPYVSKDGGAVWRALPLPAGTTDEESVVWSICLDPADPETVYVGTQGFCVFKGTGGDWRRLPIAEPEGVVCANFPMRVIRIVVDPQDSRHILVAFEIGGVVRSRDGGESWQSCNDSLLALSEEPHLRSAIVSDQEIEGMMDSHAMVLQPRNPDTVWLANRMGLFRSDDDGGTWQEFGIGRFSPLTYARDVIVSAHREGRMYAALSVAATSDEGALYRSEDNGTTWSRFDADVSIDSTLMAVAEGAENPDRVYCAARRGQVFGTEDGGASWQSYALPGGVQGVYAIACT
jgi:photosystem II stability/assembly factor-like uncharacterized protein